MYTGDENGNGAGVAPSEKQRAFDAFMMETSGGHHATDLDWTRVGRDKDGFPVVKGSPEDVSAPVAVLDAEKAKTTAADPNKVGASAATDASGNPVATSATAVGALRGATMAAISPRQQTAQQAADEAEDAGEGTTTLYFPHRVVLTVRHGHTIEFPAGPNAVPNTLAGHYYLKANGASTTPPGHTAARPGAGTQAGGKDMTLEQAKALVAKLEAQQAVAQAAGGPNPGPQK
jgi:hypothetical protein